MNSVMPLMALKKMLCLEEVEVEIRETVITSVTAVMEI
jgi:hypothetical protein